MPMEVEFLDMGPEHIEVDSADVSPADLINGRGEVESSEHTEATIDDVVQALVKSGEATPGPECNEDGKPINQGKVDVEQFFDELREVAEDKTDPDYQASVDWRARFDAEYAHEREIAEAKEEHTKASLARAAAEDAYKAAKSHEKACLATLSALIARGPNYPKPVNQGGGDNDSAIDAAVRNDKSSPAIPLDDPNADQTWRSIPIAPMLEGIKGMGQKKQEAILSLTPTLGDFEDLRGKASQSHKALYEVMPKGVGRAMADELEERALSAMSKHQAEIARNQPGEGDGDDGEAVSDQPVSASVASADSEPEYEDVENDDLDSDDSADTYSDADVEG